VKNFKPKPKIKDMKKECFTKNIFALLIFFMYCNFSMGQELTVTGTITEKPGSPLPGVTLQIKGTQKGTTSDLDGKYSIQAEPNSILVFSFVGYETQEVPVNGRTVIDIEMKASSETIEELVVIGYGTVKKMDLTGAVTAVGTKDFNKGILSSPQSLISGKIAGVVVTSGSGAPGSSPTVRVRGSSSLNASQDPLFVIDGVVIDNSGGVSGSPNALSMINPNDIESMTVLKDASSTAIYGSRATNGVILVTTKKAGKELKIIYNGTFSVNPLPKMLDVLNGNEYRDLIAKQVADGYLTTAASSLLGSANTDWQKEIYRTAYSQDHNISVSGTVKNILPYRVSLGQTNDNGSLKGTDFKRTTINIGVNPNLLDDHLKLNLNFKGMYNVNDFGATDALGAAIAYDPTQPVKNDNTRWRGYTTWTTGDVNSSAIPLATSNPVALINLRDDYSYVTRSIGNAQVDYKLHFFPDMHINVNAAYDYSKTKGHVNVADSTGWTYSSTNTGGRTEQYDETRKKQLLETYATYEKNIEAIQSKVSVMGGYSWEYYYRSKSDTAMNAAVDYMYSYSSSKTRYYLVSFYGRLNYDLMDKYLFTFTLRDDGTSRFSKDNRWGLFPSAALAWKIKSEAFLKEVNLISDMKLRLGYGVTGQQELSSSLGSDFPYLAVYQYGYSTSMYQFGNMFYNIMRPNAYDQNIKWETTTTYNVALDFGLFNNRLNGTIEYYSKKTKDLISKVTAPAGTNLSNAIVSNVGDMENKGIEVTLNGRLIESKDIFWELGCNLSYNKNKITNLTKSANPGYYIQTGDISGGTGNKIQVHKVGEPMNSFFVYQQVYDNNGDPIEGLYVDRNQDGIINSSDLYCYKNPAPDVLIGISSRFGYKDFELSFAGRLSLGNYVYNNVASGSTYSSLYPSSYLANVNYSANETKFQTRQWASDYYVENASFFRMDNITLSYKVPIKLNKLNMHVNAMVQNAFIITKYKGLDPEVYSGIDNNLYPRSRSFILGINIEF
jgi:TonB-dependent starch-binding outer membrane protein SusC